jgi:hypothetical protein
MQMGLSSTDKNRFCFQTFEHSCGGMLYGLDSGQIYTLAQPIRQPLKASINQTHLTQIKLS